MSKVLIIGAGIEQVAAIEVAQSLGHTAIVTDMNPEAPGVKLADTFFEASTTDIEANILIAKREQVDGVMTICSETAIPTVANIATALGLPGITPETAKAATDKNYMRKKFNTSNVPCPKSMDLYDVDGLSLSLSSMKPPWVIKPSDSSGQRGIKCFSDTKLAKSFFEEARSCSKNGKVIIEEFIEGPEINVCAMVNDGVVSFLSIASRITNVKKNFGIAVKHLHPSNLDTFQIEQVKEASQKAIDAIGLRTGIAYPQLIFGNDGPFVIEIAARMPGGYNREVALYTSGIDMVEVAVRQCLGETISTQRMHTAETFASTYVRFITRNDLPESVKQVQHISGLGNVESLPFVKKVVMLLEPGDHIPDLTNSTARFGAVITVGSTQQEAIENGELAIKKIEIV